MDQFITFSLSSLNDSYVDVFEKSELSCSDVPTSFVDSLKISDVERKNKSIKMFDVSENGQILICFNDGSANVYSEDTSFKYSFSYKTRSNQSSSVFWERENIVVFLDRSDLLIAINDRMEIINVYKYINNIDNAYAYEKLKHKTNQDTAGYQYYLNTDLFVTELIQIDMNGKEKLVYSTKNEFWFLLPIMCLFIFIFIVIILRMISVKKRSNTKSS